MIVCPNCTHLNPEGAQACEDCYTPLPATTTCPNCGTSVQTDSRFCGQCGLDLHSSTMPIAPDPIPPTEPLLVSNVIPPPTAVPISKQETPSPPLNPTPEYPPKAEPVKSNSQTELQHHQAQLFHVQSNTVIEIPQKLSVIHIGKPNDRIPPDVDVAGFTNSEIVSRIHADIRLEGDAYYIEDVGSSNGTYVNNMPLLPGNRHRLRVGDRIALGKGDLVTFLFQSS